MSNRRFSALLALVVLVVVTVAWALSQIGQGERIQATPAPVVIVVAQATPAPVQAAEATLEVDIDWRFIPFPILPGEAMAWECYRLIVALDLKSSATLGKEAITQVPAGALVAFRPAMDQVNNFFLVRTQNMGYPQGYVFSSTFESGSVQKVDCPRPN